MPKFELKKYKGQVGHEGPGYACELWMDGKLAAHCFDEGNGGSPILQYVSPEVRRQIQEHISTMPPFHWEADDYHNASDEPMTQELFMLQLVEAHETRKTFVRQCKTKTLFRLKSDKSDEYHICKQAYSPIIVEWLRKQFGDNLVEIINETLAKE